MNSFDEVFSAVKEFCKEKLPLATYNLWISDIQAESFDGNKAVLKLNSDFKCKTVSARYQDLLKEAFFELMGFDVDLDLICPEQPAATPVPQQDTKPEINFSVPNGSYTYTFDNFIVGSTNKMAHAAALAVAANPSRAYNPLFIYGDSGLGKTHLMNAIRIEIQQNNPNANIVYVDGEAFANELISAIQNNSTSAFHEKYRAADVLFVDDIQFIGGKDRTQEEFFHTFNTLHQNDKQIVLASDRAPKEIKSLEDRLRTRFEWGLITDIQAPDFETRVAIINRKVSLLGIDMPEDVTEYIANSVKNNIRQLEGVVKKINAYRQIEGLMPCIAVAQRAIKDILSHTQPLPVTIDKILNEVARTFNISFADIRSRKRTSAVSNARKTAMYVVREITGLSTLEIGKEFGGRDHSTVVYALKEVEKELEQGGYLKERVEDIIKNVKG